MYISSNIEINVLFSYLHSSSFQNGHYHSQRMDMNCFYIADMRIVVAILIVCVYSKVRHICAVTRFRHQVRTVSHEVVAPLIKGGVMGVTRSNTGGSSCE